MQAQDTRPDRRRPRDVLSAGQRRRLDWCAAERGWSPQDLDTACAERWGRETVAHLTRREATAWITELERREP